MKKIGFLMLCIILFLTAIGPLWVWAAEPVKTQAQIEDLILKNIKPNETTEAQTRTLLGEPSSVKEYTQTYLSGQEDWRLLQYGPDLWVKVYKKTDRSGLVREKSIN